jgi:hypothetical protein
MIAAVAALVIAGGLWILNKREPADTGSGPNNTSTTTQTSSSTVSRPVPAPPKESPLVTTVPDKEKPAPSVKEPDTAAKTTVASSPTAPTATAVAVPPVEPPPAAAPPIDPALVSLRKKYTAALTNALTAAERVNEASKLLALRSELALIEKGGTPPDLDEPGTPLDLAKLRSIYRKEAAALTKLVVTEDSSSAPSVKPPVGMPADAVAFNGRWYRFYPEHPTWHAARDKCVKAGGMLAVVPDKATWDFIKRLVGEQWVWLGATDEKSEGVWTWLDGTAMTFKKWQKDEPNNTGAKQHYLRVSSKGWRDDEKQAPEVVGYVCEWRPK